MKISLFSVYDAKVETYSAPLPFKHKGEAMRWMIDQTQAQGTNIQKWPADFTLFEIASFDDSTGLVTMLQGAIPLGNGLDFVAMAKQ